MGTINQAICHSPVIIAHWEHSRTHGMVAGGRHDCQVSGSGILPHIHPHVFMPDQ